MAKPQQISGVLGLAGDLDKKTNPYLPTNDFYELNGLYFGESLSLTKRLGFEKFNSFVSQETYPGTAGTHNTTFTGLWEYSPSTATSPSQRRQIAVGLTDVYVYNTPSALSWNIISDRAVLKRTVADSTFLSDAVTLLDQMYIGNGQDRNLRWDGTAATPKLFRMGEDYPTSVEMAAFTATSATTGGLITAGTYRYVVTFENDRNMESNPGSLTDIYGLQSTLISAVATCTGTTASVTLSGIPVSAQVQVTKRNIYRTAANGGTYLYLGTIADNTTTTYSDTQSDAALGIAVEQFSNGVPLPFNMVDIYQGVAFMANNNSTYTPASAQITNKSRVWFSGNSKPYAVDPNDYFDLDPNDGDIIRGIKRYQGTIVVFKDNSIWNAVGENRDNFAFLKVVSSVGAVNNACIVDVPTKNVLCAITNAGKFFFYDGTSVTPTAIGLEPILKNLNFVQLSRTVGVAVPSMNQVRWIVPYLNSTYCNMIVWYDYLQDKWGTTLIPNTIANFCTTMRDSDNKPMFYVAGVYDLALATGGGYVWKGDTSGSDDGSNILCEAMDRGHPKQDPNPTNNKQFYHCFVWFKPVSPGPATASVYAHKNDPDGTPLLIGTVDLTKPSGIDHIHFNMVGRRCYIHVSESSQVGEIVIRGWQVWFKDVGQHHAP